MSFAVIAVVVNKYMHIPVYLYIYIGIHFNPVMLITVVIVLEDIATEHCLWFWPYAATCHYQVADSPLPYGLSPFVALRVIPLGAERLWE